MSSDGKRVNLWDLTTRKMSARLPVNLGDNIYLLFAPDGHLLLAGNNARLLWDVRANKLVRDFKVAFGDTTSVAFSPDSRVLVCGDTWGKVQLWDVETEHEKMGSFLGVWQVMWPAWPSVQMGDYWQAAFFGVSIRKSGRWRPVRRRATSRTRRCDTNVLAFTPDGRAVASGNGDNNIADLGHVRRDHATRSA